MQAGDGARGQARSQAWSRGAARRAARPVATRGEQTVGGSYSHSAGAGAPGLDAAASMHHLFAPH